MRSPGPVSPGTRRPAVRRDAPRYVPARRGPLPYASATAQPRGRTTPLLRHQIGDVLRERRPEQARTLREVSAAARVSLGYLSAVERGQKEASSELLGAICGALGVPLSWVLREVSDRLAMDESLA
ncbi:MAG: helix-turn-helix domain-containing protein, partial [Actinomycetes bacterium]